MIVYNILNFSPSLLLGQFFFFVQHEFKFSTLFIRMFRNGMGGNGIRHVRRHFRTLLRTFCKLPEEILKVKIIYYIFLKFKKTLAVIFKLPVACLRLKLSLSVKGTEINFIETSNRWWWIRSAIDCVVFKKNQAFQSLVVNWSNLFYVNAHK